MQITTTHIPLGETNAITTPGDIGYEMSLQGDQLFSQQYEWEGIDCYGRLVSSVKDS